MAETSFYSWSQSPNSVKTMGGPSQFPMPMSTGSYIDSESALTSLSNGRVNFPRGSKHTHDGFYGGWNNGSGYGNNENGDDDDCDDESYRSEYSASKRNKPTPFSDLFGASGSGGGGEDDDDESELKSHRKRSHKGYQNIAKELLKQKTIGSSDSPDTFFEPKMHTTSVKNTLNHSLFKVGHPWIVKNTTWQGREGINANYTDYDSIFPDEAAQDGEFLFLYDKQVATSAQIRRWYSPACAAIRGVRFGAQEVPISAWKPLGVLESRQGKILNVIRKKFALARNEWIGVKNNEWICYKREPAAFIPFHCEDPPTGRANIIVVGFVTYSEDSSGIIQLYLGCHNRGSRV